MERELLRPSIPSWLRTTAFSQLRSGCCLLNSWLPHPLSLSLSPLICSPERVSCFSLEKRCPKKSHGGDFEMDLAKMTPTTDSTWGRFRRVFGEMTSDINGKTSVARASGPLVKGHQSTNEELETTAKRLWASLFWRIPRSSSSSAPILR